MLCYIQCTAQILWDLHNCTSASLMMELTTRYCRPASPLALWSSRTDCVLGWAYNIHTRGLTQKSPLLCADQLFINILRAWITLLHWVYSTGKLTLAKMEYLATWKSEENSGISWSFSLYNLQSRIYKYKAYVQLQSIKHFLPSEWHSVNQHTWIGPGTCHPSSESWLYHHECYCSGAEVDLWTSALMEIR